MVLCENVRHIITSLVQISIWSFKPHIGIYVLCIIAKCINLYHIYISEAAVLAA